MKDYLWKKCFNTDEISLRYIKLQFYEKEDYSTDIFDMERFNGGDGDKEFDDELD